MKRIVFILAALILFCALWAEALNEGFDTSPVMPPANWSVLYNNGHTLWNRTNTVYHSSPMSAVIAGSNFSTTLVTPPLKPTAANYTFSFWIKSFTYPQDQFAVYLSPTYRTTIGYFNVTLQPWTSAQPVWLQYTYNLAPYIGRTVYIGITVGGTAVSGIFLDDVLGPDINLQPPSPATCVSPSNGSGNISTHATLNWAIGTEYPLGFKLYFGTDGGGVTPPTNICNNNYLGPTLRTYTPSTLVYNTTYYWQIVPYNDYGNAVNQPIWSFTTTGPFPPPYEVGFNSVGSLPSGWSSETGYGMTQMGLDNSWCLFFQLSNGANRNLTSAMIGPLGNNALLRFYYIAKNLGGGAYTMVSGDSIVILVSTNDGQTYARIGSINSTNHTPSATMGPREFSLAAFSGSNIRIKFLMKNTASMMWEFYLDQVMVMNGNTVRSYPSGESFDGPTFPTEGWQNVANTGTGIWWIGSSSESPDLTPQEGPYFGYYDSLGEPEGNSASLISPPLLTLGKNKMYSLSFWLYRYADGTHDYNPDKLEVYASASPNLGNAVLLETFHRSRFLAPAVPNDGWYNYSVDLGVGNWGYKYVYLKAVSAGGNQMHLDSIILTEPDITSVPSPALALSPENGSSGISILTALRWTSGGNFPSGYRLNFGTDGEGSTAPSNIAANQDLGFVRSYTPATALLNNTTYYWQIVPYNYLGNAANCPIFSFTTQYPEVLIGNGSLTMTVGQSLSFFDSGGPLQNYGTNQDFIFTCYPPEGYLCLADFDSYLSEEGADFLSAYNGASTSAPLLGTWSGSCTVPELAGENPTGALTFVFHSDGSNSFFPGWAARLWVHRIMTPPVVSLTKTPTGAHLSITPVPDAEWYGIYISFTSTGLMNLGSLSGEELEIDLIIDYEPKLFFAFTSGFGIPPTWDWKGASGNLHPTLPSDADAQSIIDKLLKSLVISVKGDNPD